MAVEGAIQRARACFEQQAWREARELFVAADQDAPLQPDDVDRLATCAYLLGDVSDAADLLSRAHQAFQQRGDLELAARCAFRLGITQLGSGQGAHASGWLARCKRLLDDLGRETVIHGYLLIPEGIRATGNPGEASKLFTEAAAIGQRFGDRDLVAVARQGIGRMMLRVGRIAEGVALLDEVMVGVTAGEVSPIVAGDVYCSVIEACHEIFDLRRAQEWTAALTRWCDRHSDTVPYRGACLIRRAEVMRLHGEWADALGEAERACERLTVPPPKPAIGAAHYQRAELHRLRGELAKAEDAYRLASEAGRKPQPGLSLLRLAQGDVDAALASIRRFVDDAGDRTWRSRVLAAYVEILLAAGDVATARAAASELADIATFLDARFLHATAAHARGAVLLAEDHPDAAVTELEMACEIWRENEVPYEDARTRVLLAVALRRLGDVDTGDLELAAARRTFQRLGAATDLARLDELTRPSTPRGARELTGRELEVLGLIATGKTNRAIADALGLSEKTVARHVSNIFTKIGVSTRAAATAYAYRRRLV
jgi:ATP/maltotriose-dependent transcriptional regulator MalT